ncbi:hypothetical protein LBMAG42_43670 [Deltaproteobacteria bacterium]|nr:hypothetical protein LBMAG42_43670 [Deltaproteobacteria bacterium]
MSRGQERSIVEAHGDDEIERLVHVIAHDGSEFHWLAGGELSVGFGGHEIELRGIAGPGVDDLTRATAAKQHDKREIGHGGASCGRIGRTPRPL